MSELIKVENRDGIETVNARELHKFLEVGRDFSSWIKQRIEKYEFEETVDFTPVLGNSTGGRPELVYYISFDMAKELSMVENNEKGKQARKYFIELEKESKKILSPAEFMVQQSQILLAQEKELIKINTRLNEVEAKQLTINKDYYSIIGWCNLYHIKVSISDANSLGRLCAKASRAQNIPIDKIHDPRFGQINAYHKDILTEVVL
jgi:phage anti-repressor protein